MKKIIKVQGEITIDLSDYIGDENDFEEIISACSEDDGRLMKAAQNLYNYYDATREDPIDDSKENERLFGEYEKTRKEYARNIIKNFLEMTFET